MSEYSLHVNRPPPAVGSDNAALVEVSDANPLPSRTLAEQLSVTPLITASNAYNASQCVGGVLTFNAAYRTVAGQLLLQDLLVTDKANQKANFTILFFDSNPTNGTYTDHSNTALGTDVSKIAGQVLVGVSDYTTTNGTAVVNLKNIGLLLQAAANNQNLYAAMTTNSTANYATNQDLTFRFKCLEY